MSTDQMAKVDRNAFLSESESRNLSFVPFWRRFYFSSSDCECQELIKAKILTKIVISLHEVKWEWFSQIFIKSSLLWHYLHKLKNPYYCFHWSKISFMTCDWSDAHFSLVRKTIWPIQICTVFYKSIFFSNLAWRKSQYISVHFPMEGHIL